MSGHHACALHEIACVCVKSTDCTEVQMSTGEENSPLTSLVLRPEAALGAQRRSVCHGTSSSGFGIYLSLPPGLKVLTLQRLVE